ncbi:hypothetical protein DFS34DRAFT_327321 [Phlyctochytrium arcticum]|nr:hypothetical protein DFS34DRAFT_327321 [Phlyctochytrium arcticum]
MLAGRAAKHLGVSAVTLRRWEQQGRIQTTRAPSGHRIYDVTSIRMPPTTSTSTSAPSSPTSFTGKTQEKEKEGGKRESYIYARVSSRKQHPDLQRQVALLKQRYPSFTVITDIGSGINILLGLREGYVQVSENQANPSIVALDPGVVSFHT